LNQVSDAQQKPCDVCLQVRKEVTVLLPPSVRQSLQLLLDFDSTAVRLLTKGHQGHSDVTR